MPYFGLERQATLVASIQEGFICLLCTNGSDQTKADKEARVKVMKASRPPSPRLGNMPYFWIRLGSDLSLSLFLCNVVSQVGLEKCSRSIIRKYEKGRFISVALSTRLSSPGRSVGHVTTYKRSFPRWKVATGEMVKKAMRSEQRRASLRWTRTTEAWNEGQAKGKRKEGSHSGEQQQ